MGLIEGWSFTDILLRNLYFILFIAFSPVAVTARTLHQPTLVLAVAVVTPRLILHTTNLHLEAAAATSKNTHFFIT